MKSRDDISNRKPGFWGEALVEKKTFYANEGLHVPHGHIPVERVICVPIQAGNVRQCHISLILNG